MAYLENLESRSFFFFFVSLTDEQSSYGVYKAVLHRKSESKSLRDDHKRCNREPRVQHNPIKAAATVLSGEQRPERGSVGEGVQRERKQKGSELELGEEIERVKIKQWDKRGVSQRCIHSSKVTDPHPRLLLGAKCSAEEPDELMSLGRSRRRKREMGNKGVKKTERQTGEPRHPLPTQPSTPNISL